MEIITNTFNLFKETCLKRIFYTLHFKKEKLGYITIMTQAIMAEMGCFWNRFSVFLLLICLEDWVGGIVGGSANHLVTHKLS